MLYPSKRYVVVHNRESSLVFIFVSMLHDLWCVDAQFAAVTCAAVTLLLGQKSQGLAKTCLVSYCRLDARYR